MTITACEEQFVAEAERVKGEETTAPLPGLLTLMPANAGPVDRASIEPIQNALRIAFIKGTCVSMVCKS